MATETTPTTITVPGFVRRALAKYRTSGKTYRDVTVALVEEYPTEPFLQEMDRRFREEPRVSLNELRKHGAYWSGVLHPVHVISCQ